MGVPKKCSSLVDGVSNTVVGVFRGGRNSQVPGASSPPQFINQVRTIPYLFYFNPGELCTKLFHDRSYVFHNKSCGSRWLR